MEVGAIGCGVVTFRERYMKLHGLFGAALTALALVAGIAACSSSTSATGKGRCTPGAYVFCRCQDGADGSKLCQDDGDTFEACTTGDGLCVGGEDLTDPREGEEIDPPAPKPTTDGGGGPSGPPIEACPGKATAVSPGPEIVIDGDTTGARDDAKGATGACAVGGQGPDHVYHLQPTGKGQLSIKVKGEGALNPTVYLRTTCDDVNSQSKCAETTGVAGLEQFTVNVVTGRDYYLFVDGASGSAGKYKLTMKLTTGTFCGDGTVDPNEACDDGNNTDGDGCSPSCQQVNGDPTSGNGCPGHSVHLWPGRTVSGTGSTLPYANTFTKTGTSCLVSANNLNAAQDHIYEVTPHGNGNLKVTITPTEATYNVMVVARSTCTDPASQSGAMCANNGVEGAAETITFPVTSGNKVYVAADGNLNQKGSYTIQFELP